MPHDARELKFLATPEKGEVSALLVRPEGATHLLVLGHGASTDMRHPTMQSIAERLAGVGIATFRYNFPYSENGKGRDPQAVCTATVRSAVKAASPRDPESVAWAYSRLAAYELQRGRLEDAARMVDSALQFVPDYAAALDTPPEGLRVGVPREFFGEGLDAEVESAIREAVKVYEQAGATVKELRGAEELKEMIRDCRDVLISCNQRLVYAQAKQKLALGENIDDLVSDGNLSLMRAVEKFDYGRGFKFSTCATWAIMKNFAGSIPDAKTHKQRYMTGHDDLFEAKADVRTDEQEVLAQADAARARVNRLLEHLDARTREVIRMRTGLDGSEEMTLEP